MTVLNITFCNTKEQHTVNLVLAPARMPGSMCGRLLSDPQAPCSSLLNSKTLLHSQFD